jgi:hypothetical protein
MDLVFEGLKTHNKQHFLAAGVFNSYEAMKKDVILYNEISFVHRFSKENNYKKEKKRALVQSLDVNNATALGSGSDRLYVKLAPELWKECMLQGLCFKCRNKGKQVKGFSKEHPNHPKKEEPQKTQKKDFKKKAQVAAVEAE